MILGLTAKTFIILHILKMWAKRNSIFILNYGCQALSSPIKLSARLFFVFNDFQIQVIIMNLRSFASDLHSTVYLWLFPGNKAY
jgi:hypothetical protein